MGKFLVWESVFDKYQILSLKSQYQEVAPYSSSTGYFALDYIKLNLNYHYCNPKKYFCLIFLLLITTKSFPLYHILNGRSLVNISVSILINASPILLWIVPVTWCLSPHCLKCAWILFAIYCVCSGYITTLNSPNHISM